MVIVRIFYLRLYYLHALVMYRIHLNLLHKLQVVKCKKNCQNLNFLLLFFKDYFKS